MSESPSPPSRSADVLDEAFVRDLHDLPTEEVRRRRDRALAEREYLSYLRRLVQVRHDLLAAELRRREEGASVEPLIDRLTRALAAGSKGGARGEAIRDALTASDVDQADARCAAVVGDVNLAAPHTIGDGALRETVAALGEEERAVSAERTAVLRIHDRLQAELTRRYREDPSRIPRGM